MNKLTSLSVALVLFVAGCTTTSTAPIGTGVQSLPAASDVPETGPEQEVLPEVEPTLFRGTDLQIALPRDREAIRLDGEAVTLNFEEAPLTEVVHSVLGDILELDYIVEHPIEGSVTLRTRTPVSRDNLLGILESLLQSNGALMVRDPNDRFYVSASPALGALLPGIDGPASSGAGYSNVIVPLSYIGAAEMAEILSRVAPETAFVRVDSRRNLLVLAGTRNQINGWMGMVDTFDVDQLAGMSVGVFPLENATVDEIRGAIQQIITGSDGSAGGGGETGVDTEDMAGGGGASGLVRLIPLERLNSILVITPRAYYLDRVREWIERLDHAQNASSEPTLHVYAVQNGNAVQMAELLNRIFSRAGTMGAQGGRQDSGVAPGLSSMGSGAGSMAGGAGGAMGGGMPATGGQQGQGQGAMSFDLDENVRVVADNFNNALLIYAPRNEFNKIKGALEKLDLVPAQVLIEASILEVTLTDEFSFGLEWSLRNSLGSGYTGSGLLNLGDSGSIGPRAPGFSYSMTNNAGDVRAVVNMLAQKSLVNVISTPSIMVLDNHTAAIHVGDQQPFIGSVFMGGIGNTQQSIEFKDTGVKLEVTPSVNSGGLVTLDILQSVTDIGPVDTATGQRSFLERNVSSRVAIRNGESVVLGGLIRDNTSRGQNGLPYLQDIPLIGPLFGRTTRDGTRTELLVFISPRVITDEQGLREISSEMRARMKGLQHFEDLPVNLGEGSSSAAE